MANRLKRFLPVDWPIHFGATKNGANGTAVAAPPEKKSLPTIDFAGPNMGSLVYFNTIVPGEVEAVNRETAYAAALYLYVAVKYRAENLAEPPLVVVEETDDGTEIIEDHPLAELLDEPSPDYDMGEMIELTQTWLDIDAHALWVKDANLAGSLGRLTPFGGREFKVHPTRDRVYGQFVVTTARGTDTFLPEDVVYFRTTNPYGRHKLLSPTDVALAWLNLGQRTTATVKSILANALFPGLVYTPDKDWHPTDEEMAREIAKLNQHHAGPSNAGKPFVAMSGATVQRVTFPLKELLPDELLDRVEACVAAAFGIPPVVLSFLVGLKNSPWSQMEEARRYAYEDTLEPLWRKHSKRLTRQLLRPVDPTPKRRIVFDTSEIRALKVDESRRVTDAGTAKWWTLNERRVWTGQDPLPDGDERGEWIEAHDPRFAEFSLSSEGKMVQRVALAPEAHKPSDRDTAWKRFDLIAKAQEASWESGVYAELRADRKAVLALFDKSVGKSAEQGFETKEPPDVDPEAVDRLIAGLVEALSADRWTERLTPLIESTGKTAVRELASEIGLSFDLLSPALLDYTRREAAFLVDNIPAHTRDRIAAELRAGLAEGETIRDLRKRIEDLPAFNRNRAQLVARTETTRVTNGSRHESLTEWAADEGVKAEKSWLSARDGSPPVRPMHAKLDDGSWIPLNQPFANGLQAPGEPNCRCTVLHRLSEEEDDG